MDSRPLIFESLQILSFVFLNPFSSNSNNRIYEKCTVMVVISTLINIGLDLILNYQGIDSTIEVLVVIAFGQISMKMSFLLAYKKEVILLINNTRMFWRSNFYDSDQQEENEKLFLFVKLCVRLYVVSLVIICILYFIRPLLLAEVLELPWKSYSSQFLNYTECYILQVFQCTIFITTQLGYDTLFISLITNIIFEFKLVEKRFPNLKINPEVRGTDKEAMDELKKLIDHHNLILGCAEIMKYVYSGPLLVLFSSNLFGMCFSLIIVTTSTSNNTIKLIFGMVAIFDMVQLFFYCICGSMTADESVKISAQVYKSKWWIKTQPELRKALIMVIRRANKPTILTAGGLLQVNLQTFTMIIRSTISFFTFMQVIFGNSK